MLGWHRGRGTPLRREHAADRSFLARFFDEARIQAQLQHPGVAQVLEASTDQSGKPYVVLEHIEGRNLSEIRQRAAQLKAPMSWADGAAIAVALIRFFYPTPTTEPAHD